MREILFRGKRMCNGKMMFGSLMIFNGDDCYIVGDDFHHSHYRVHPETVGQFTGLTDKNGTKIFEGDIFKMEDEIVAVIIFHEGCFRLQTWGLCGTYTESGYDECGGGWGIIECEPIDWYYIHHFK